MAAWEVLEQTRSRLVDHTVDIRKDRRIVVEGLPERDIDSFFRKSFREDDTVTYVEIDGYRQNITPRYSKPRRRRRTDPSPRVRRQRRQRRS